MEHYLPIAFIAVIVAFGYLLSEYFRLMKCVNDLRSLTDALRHAHNMSMTAVAELIPPEENHLKEKLNLVVMESDFQ